MTATVHLSPVSPPRKSLKPPAEKNIIKPPLLKFAVWCGIMTLWVGIVTTLAHATAEGKGPNYVSMIIALFCVAPFAPIGFWCVRKHAYSTIAAALLTMVSATAITTVVKTFDGDSVISSAISSTCGSLLFIASVFAELMALYELDNNAQRSIRFLLVEFVMIALVVWTESIAPALAASVAYWWIYRFTAAPVTHKMRRLE